MSVVVAWFLPEVEERNASAREESWLIKVREWCWLIERNWRIQGIQNVEKSVFVWVVPIVVVVVFRVVVLFFFIVSGIPVRNHPLACEINRIRVGTRERERESNKTIVVLKRKRRDAYPRPSELNSCSSSEESSSNSCLIIRRYCILLFQLKRGMIIEIKRREREYGIVLILKRNWTFKRKEGVRCVAVAVVRCARRVKSRWVVTWRNVTALTQRLFPCDFRAQRKYELRELVVFFATRCLQRVRALFVDK